MEKNSLFPQVVNFSGDILDPYVIDGCGFNNCENQTIASYYLINAQQPHSHVDSHDKTVSTVQMNNGYWLYCGFEFYKRKNKRKELKQFVLHFFDDTNPLFRAEWACQDIPESRKHAQPHWHLDAKTKVDVEEGFGEKMMTFDDYQRHQSNRQSRSVDLGRAHFFMNWNMEKDKDREAPYMDFRDEGKFRRWLGVTMKYVDTELRALTKR